MDSDQDKPRVAEIVEREPQAPEVGLDDTLAVESDPRQGVPAVGLERPAVGPKTISVTQTEEPSADRQSTPAATLLRPGTMLGQYQLIRELGRGGMGAVHLARDTRLGRRVAIKFLAHDDPAVAERFLAEARVTARCKHDNIVVIHDIGEAPGSSYMVLEYLEGVTLRAWLKDRWQSSASADENARAELEAAATSQAMNDTPVSATLAVELMVPVVRALAHAHARGLVHRDLKPENVMLADEGSIKVLDFGIAKVLDHLLESRATSQAPGPGTGAEPGHGSSEQWSERAFETHAGALVGTIPYMSPEQWGAGAVDARTDVWAVGIMFWELCTGGHPLAPLSQQRIQSIGSVEMPMPSMIDKRPQLGPLASIIDRCLRKRVAERIPSAQALLDQLEPLLPGRGRRTSGGSGELDNPYVGLAAFQQSDANRFYGRDRDVASMIAQLRNHRLITVAGASGAGKSSFVRAGVIPALQRSGLNWESFIIRPGRRPLAALADVLAQVSRVMSLASDGVPAADAQNALLDTLRSQPGYLGTVMRARCQSRHTRILLFVDQFEELYTLGTDRDTREAFMGCLEGVADDASSPLRVILTVRSDFMDRVAEDRAFTSEITRAMTLLSPLSRAQLRQALTEPLAAAGYTFESEALVDAMLDTLQATRSPLPLLQFTAARLWDARDPVGRRISQNSYDTLGGIEGALAGHADQVLAGLSMREQRLARTVFTHLVSEERTRMIVGLDELRASAEANDTSEPGDAVERIVRHLAEARLVLMESDSEAGATVELTHESLIDRWPKLVQWLDEDKEAAHFRSRVRSAARQWDQQGRTEDLLWRGQAADEAGCWQIRDDTALAEFGGRDRAYLQAVVGLAARTRRNRRRGLAAIMAFLGIVAVVVSLLAVRAERKAADAERQARRADDNARRADDNAAMMRVRTVEAQESAAAARNASRLASASEHKDDPTLVLALVREMEPEGQPPREVARNGSLGDLSGYRPRGFRPPGYRLFSGV